MSLLASHQQLYTHTACSNSAKARHRLLVRRCDHRTASNQQRSRHAQASASSSAESQATAAAAPAWQVYNGRMPLVGFEGLAKALKSTPLQQLLQLHTYTLLEGPDQVWYFDFLPLQPTSPATALLLLTASTAPAEVRVRQLEAQSVKTSDRVRLIGACSHHDPLAVAKEFNRRYNTQLHLLQNNCKHHTDRLSKALLAR